MKCFLAVILMCAMLLSMQAVAEETTQNEPGREDIAVASFDQDFLSYIHAQNEKENYIVSPLSFRAALILAVEGADSATRAQLLNAMGFSSEEEMTQWYAAVTESVDFFEGWVTRQEQMAEEEAQFYPPGEAPEVPVHAYRVLNSVWNNTDRFGEFLPAIFVPLRNVTAQQQTAYRRIRLRTLLTTGVMRQPLA